MIRDRLEGVPVPTPVRVRWASLRANRWLQLARRSQARGDLDEAAMHAYEAIRVLSGCPPAVLAAEVAYTAAEIECGRAQYLSSAAHFERAAELLGALPPRGNRDRRLADVHIGLAEVHRRNGWYAEAGASLTAARNLVHGRDPAIVMLLGVIAVETGRFGDAARHYARLERARLNHSDTATLHHNLAVLATAQYRYADAEQHARHALLLRCADPRATAVDVAREVAILAAAVAGQHRYDEARDLFGQAMAACRAARPIRHYEIAVHLYNLAGIEHDCGNLAAAEQLYRQALAIKEWLLGPTHREVALIMSNMAILLRDLGRKDEAAAYFRHALTIAEHIQAG